MLSLFKHIPEQSKAYLTFNYAERRGIMVLVMLILLVEGVNAFLPSLIKEESFDMSEFEKDIKKFEAALVRPDTLVKTVYKEKHSPKREYPNYTYKKKAGPARPPMIIEINTADSAKFVGLYGIGAVFADRILKYRGLLGGFFNVEQLKEVYGMDSIRYQQIEAYVEADTSKIIKIPVNEAEFKSLLHHPYLDYETVKSIVNYRREYGIIPNQDTLRNVIGYDPMFEKIKPYMEYRVASNE
jgi:competence protein ComEA